MSKGLTCERLREVIHYNPLTGIFTWRIARKKCTPGKVAGRIGGSGYWSIRIDYFPHSAHRLAWLYVTGSWPEDEIDHIDGSKLNNKFTNLRAAHRTQNAANMAPPRNNTSGTKGIRWHLNRWQAEFQHAGWRVPVGRFHNLEDAKRELLTVQKKLNGEFTQIEKRAA